MNKILFLLLLFSQITFAGQPQLFSYSGTLKDGSGNTISGPINVTTTVLSPSPANCILFEDSHLNVSTDISGNFSIQIGAGIRTSRDSGSALSLVFANTTNSVAIPSSNCSSGYFPAVGDQRYLHISVTIGTVLTDLSPDLAIGSVPSALVAETIQGLSISDLIPAGTAITFTGLTCPIGYLAANGDPYDPIAYPNLSLALAGTSWGGNLPDMRGVFPRGVDAGRGLDVDAPSRLVGSYEGDMYQSHAHGVSDPGHAHQIAAQTVVVGSGGAIAPVFVFSSNNSTQGTRGALTGISIQASGGNENRPKNVAVLYCIKY